MTVNYELSPDWPIYGFESFLAKPSETGSQHSCARGSFCINFPILATNRQSIRLSKRNALEEIHFQSAIEVEFMEETSEDLVEKVYEELFESIYALRNKESMELFGEDFETIRDRQNIFLNDFNKLRLIEVLFPIRIRENQKQFYPEPMLEEPLVVAPPTAKES